MSDSLQSGPRTGGSWLIRIWTGIGRHEFGVLAAVCLLAGALWGFAEIADNVLEHEARRFDTSVLLALRNPADPAQPLGPHWLGDIARDMTSLGGASVLTLVTFAAVGFLVMTRRHAYAVLVGASIGGGALLSALLKRGFDRPRPDLVPHAVEVYSASFPSGHAMLSAVTYLTLGALLARAQSELRIKAYLLLWAVLLTLLVGVSRIYLGVHWPTDVLAGWCAGAAWAMVCWLGATWFQRRELKPRSFLR